MSQYTVPLRFLVGVLVSAPAASETTGFQNEQLEFSKEPSLRYVGYNDIAERGKRQNGYVEFSVMVNKEGKPKNETIVHSTHSKFEKSAATALKRYRYAPATMDGSPVESISSVTVFMNYDTQDVVDFKSRWLRPRQTTSVMFKEFQETFDEVFDTEPRDIERLEELLVIMTRLQYIGSRAQTLLNLNRSRLYGLVSKPNRQIRALNSAIVFNNEVTREKFRLNPEDLIAVQLSLLELYLQTNRLAEFIELWDELKASGVTEVDEFLDHYNKVSSAKTNNTTFARVIEINDRGNSFQRMLKRKFEIFDVTGEINQINFRCETKYAEMEFLSETTYSLPDSWGDCTLELIGEPNSTARLLQG
ncbi:MAG: energy transducer TonB [Pseudomonadota bacterium]